MTKYNVIYLQMDKEAEYFYDEGVTWCIDKINDTDIKYLLATPEREAAPDLLEALETIGGYPALSPLDPISALDDMRQIARAAIAQAVAQD